MLPGEGFFVPTARPGPMAAAGGGVVVVAFAVLVETVVGGVLPVMRPLLGRGVGDNGGQEVALLPVDTRVVLVAVVVDVVAGYVFLISDPLLSEPPDLLGLGFVVIIRTGARRPGNAGGDGPHPRGMFPRGLTLDLVELLSVHPPPLLRRIGRVGGHEEARTRAIDARVLFVLVLLEDVVDLAVVVELLAPLLSASPELLGERCVVFSRGVASRQIGG